MGPRALAALSLLPLWGLLPQLDGARLPMTPASVVWIDGGDVMLGATAADVGYAADLCAASLPRQLADACVPGRFRGEMPTRRARLAPYGIDRTEVTQAAWMRCMIAGRCAPTRIPDDHPQLGGPRLPAAAVTYAEAERYCGFVGGRLPSEDEWEHAARGRSRRRFPWGRHYDGRLANHGAAPTRGDASDGFELAAPVGSFPDGASPFGLLDAAGNVYEWTSTPPAADRTEGNVDVAAFRIVRGGSWAHPAPALRVTSRLVVAVTDHRADLGLRCAYDPPRR